MNSKTTAVLGLKLAALTCSLFILFILTGILHGLTGPEQAGHGAEAALFLMCALHSAALSYPVIRSRWTGWRLVFTIFIVYFGVMTFLSQIETIVFLDYMKNIVPAEIIPWIFLQGTVVAALFSPLAVLVHGKMKRTQELGQPNLRLIMPWTKWVWKLLLIVFIYVFIYFAFGGLVFVPLAGPAFKEYYGDLQLPGWIFFFQIGRGLVWAALALPVIRMMKGAWWETGLAVALLFSILMGTLLLAPNEFMPARIRMAHFVEVTLSNFLFGWIVVWVLRNRQPQVS
ncbi:MAG TPA: hypothetical protein VM123_15265 [archaeon]|nr:hypothetical protein [archaeon]